MPRSKTLNDSKAVAACRALLAGAPGTIETFTDGGQTYVAQVASIDTNHIILHVLWASPTTTYALSCVTVYRYWRGDDGRVRFDGAASITGFPHRTVRDRGAARRLCLELWRRKARGEEVRAGAESLVDVARALRAALLEEPGSLAKRQEALAMAQRMLGET